MRRQPELFGGQDLRRDDAKDRADPVPILEHVGAEAREAGDLVGEVGVVTRFEFRLVDRRHDLAEQPCDHLGRERPGGLVQRAHLAVLAHERRHRRAQVQVGGLQLAHPAEHRVDRRLRRITGADPPAASSGAEPGTTTLGASSVADVNLSWVVSLVAVSIAPFYRKGYARKNQPNL